MRYNLVNNILSKLMCTALTKKPGHGPLSYQDAVSTLNHLQSNAATIERIRKERGAQNKKNIPSMIEFVKRIGLTMEDIDKLPVIHISGTKGKGSTSAFCESILRHTGYKTGFFSSPHLVKVTERFRINGQPISDDTFTSYFFDVFNKLESTKDDMQDRQMPTYFAFLTVLAFNIFIKENVDVAIVEVGIGGQYDSTNFIRMPVVCGVTSLGIDHVVLLGDTIDKIAWNKAGIFKKGIPALIVDQPPEATSVLLQRSLDIGAPLYRVPTLQQFCDTGQQLSLGIAGNMQYHNAGLALQLCRVFIDRINKERQYLFDESYVPCVEEIPMLPVYRLSPDVVEGLASCTWPGRNQTIGHRGLTYYLDGAHTKESMQQCVQWFSAKSEMEANSIKGRVCKVLIFNATSDRNISCLLSILKKVKFDGIVFCPNLAFSGPTSNTPDQSSVCATKEKQLETSRANKKIWDSLCADCVNNRCITNGRCSALNNGLPSNPGVSPVNGSVKTALDTDNISSQFHDSESSASQAFCDNTLPNDHVIYSQVEDAKDISARINSEKRVCDDNTSSSYSYAFPCILEALHWTTQGRDPNLIADATTDVYSVPQNLLGPAHIQVLVTGSLHLVGGVLGLVQPNLSD